MNDDDLHDRDAAEQYPCRYVLPDDVRTRRAEPRRCGAAAGEHCRDPRTGRQLTRQAAHLPRLQDAGRAASSTVPHARDDA